MSEAALRTGLAALCLALFVGIVDARSEGRERHALIFGVGQYDQNNNVGLNLKSPANDVALYANVLSGIGWNVANKSFTRQHNVSRTQFEGEIEELKSRGIQGDDVLMVFVGHGYSDENGNRIIFKPPGRATSYNGPDEVKAGSVAISDVVRNIANGGPARIILIIDACSDSATFSSFISGRSQWQSSLSRESDFDVPRTELLILYSSNPGGFAYESLPGLDFGDDHNSVFTRVFAPKLREDQPLLRAFIDARIEVERLTRASKTDFIQRPSILFDNFDGAYSLKKGDAATPREEPQRAESWRRSPKLCRENDIMVREAVALRDGGDWLNEDERAAGLECIFEAMLATLGVRSVTFERGRVHMSEPGRASTFSSEDRVVRIQVKRGRERIALSSVESLAEFEDLIGQYAFKPGHQFIVSYNSEKQPDTQHKPVSF